jgi:hypothetical protein
MSNTSKTREALDWMKKTGGTAYAAAQKFGLSTATVYAASQKSRCPCCGHYIKTASPNGNPSESAVDSLLDCE